MTVRGVTVACADHGDMTREATRTAWACLAAGCGARIPDADVYRLAAAAGDGPDTVPIIVSPVTGPMVAAPDWALGTS